MANSFTEVTRQSWLGRLGESIKSVLVGILFIPGSCILLFWNEGRAVTTRQSLEEGAAAVVSVAAEKLEAANEGKLVHVTALATTTETLSDPDLSVTAIAVKLRRDCLMYQWVQNKKSETHKRVGGGSETTTTYSYDKQWKDDVVSSRDFQKGGHDNPPSKPYPSSEWTATSVTLGAFRMSASLVERMHQWKPLPLSEVPEKLLEKGHVASGEIYLGKDDAHPEVGDAKIAFRTVPPSTVSIVSRQVGGSFEPYQTKAGRAIELLSDGTVTAEAMFQSALKSNALFTWGLRFVGWLVMVIGIALLFRPFVVLSDVIPIVGSMLGLGIGLFAMAAASVVSMFIVAVAWFFFRPLLSLGLLGAGVAGIGAVWYLGKSRKRSQAT